MTQSPVHEDGSGRIEAINLEVGDRFWSASHRLLEVTEIKHKKEGYIRVKDLGSVGHPEDWVSVRAFVKRAS